MKLLIPFLAVFLICCAQSKPKTPAVPAALDGKKSEISILSKSRADDLVNDLYNQLVQSDKNLQQLEKDISHIQNSKADSLEVFQNYLTKNNHYYKEAENYISRIKDSVLSKQIAQMIEGSKAAFENKISPHQNLITVIEKKEMKLADLHTGLKLVKTLATMEAYQKDQLPFIGPIQHISQGYSKIISKTEAVMKKEE
jgi:hypothetical protein